MERPSADGRRPAVPPNAENPSRETPGPKDGGASFPAPGNGISETALFPHILDAMEDACYVSDPETFDVLYVNKAGLRALHSDQPVRGKCFQVIQQRDAPCDFCTNHLLAVGRTHTWEHFNPCTDGYYILTDTFIQVEGKTLRLELARNITEFKHRQQKLQRKLTLEETLVACVECLASDLNITDSMNRLLAMVGEYYQADRAYVFEIHYDKDSIENTYEWCRDGVSPEIDNLRNVPLPAIATWMERFKVQGAFTIESLRELVPDSLEYHVLDSQGIECLMAAPLTSGESIVGFLGVDNPTANRDEQRLLRAVPFFLQNELVKRRMLRQLEWLSFKDALTGLYNRNKYTAALGEIMACPPEKLGVLYVDINGLKAANDTYGHEYGDQVIRNVASHIRAAVRGDIYRIGGDEFIVLCPNVERAALRAMRDALLERMARQGGISVAVGESWGEGDIETADLIRYADSRMYAEKQNYYKSQLAARTSRKADAVKQLYRDIETGDFAVFLQPRFNLTTGALAGAEALISKRSACNLLVSPAKSLPVYEVEGIARQVDFHVLDTICSAMRAWGDDGAFPVTVNLSRATLLENGIARDMADVCRTHSLDPSRIHLELAESSGTLDNRLLRELTDDLHRQGFSVALGAFCSAVSNLAMLSDIRFDEIRFDKNFIQGIEDNPRVRAILEHAFALCRSLDGTRSVAEGVANARQLDFLQRKGCNLAQGSYFAAPLPIRAVVSPRQSWPGPASWNTAGRNGAP